MSSQAFLAIFRSNPEAFIDNNMNLLRAGAVLRMPTFDEMGSVSRSESVASYSEQLARFTAYQDRVRQQQETESNETLDRLISESEGEPAAVEPQPEAVVEPQAEPEAESVTAVEEETAAESTAPESTIQPAEIAAQQPEVVVEEEARLTIGQEDLEPVADGGANQEQLDALKAQLAQLDESLLASGVESESVRQNLQQIQDQVDRISTLIGVEDAALAAAQSRAMQEPEAPASQPVEPADGVFR